MKKNYLIKKLFLLIFILSGITNSISAKQYSIALKVGHENELVRETIQKAQKSIDSQKTITTSFQKVVCDDFYIPIVENPIEIDEDNLITLIDTLQNIATDTHSFSVKSANLKLNGSIYIRIQAKQELEDLVFKILNDQIFNSIAITGPLSIYSIQLYTLRNNITIIPKNGFDLFQLLDIIKRSQRKSAFHLKEAFEILELISDLDINIRQYSLLEVKANDKYTLVKDFNLAQ